MPALFDECEGLDRVPFTFSSPGEMSGYIATLSPERQEALEIELAQRQAIIKLHKKRQAAELKKREQATALDEESNKGAKETNLPHNLVSSPTFAASRSHESYPTETTTRARSPAPPSEFAPDDTEDWIKSENGLYFNAKEMEDNAMKVCGDLIFECIVAGTGRPSPIMFIVPSNDRDQDRLKKEILRRTRQFYSRRYLHERISAPEMIVIIQKSALPQPNMKGNIRREAVEEKFKLQIDQIFAQTA